MPIELQDALADLGVTALAGKSAYEIAVSRGFSGTEDEWLASLTPAPALLTQEAILAALGLNLAANVGKAIVAKADGSGLEFVALSTGGGNTGGGTTTPPTSSTLYPPTSFSLASATAYPPELAFILHPSTVEDDWLDVEYDDNRDFATPGTISLQLTAANINGTDPISVQAALASIASPAQTHLRAFTRRGGVRSAPTRVLKHGDTTAPVLTIAPTGSVDDGEPVTHAWSSTEYVALSFGGTSGGLMESEPPAGTSGIIRLANNANADFGANPSLDFTVIGTDEAGLSSEPAAVSIAVNSIGATATALHSVNGAKKSQYVAVSEGGLTATGEAGTGENCLVHFTTIPENPWKLEVTVAGITSPTNIVMGFCEPELSFAGFPQPANGTPGVRFDLHSFNDAFDIFIEGNSGVPAGGVIEGDIVSLEWNGARVILKRKRGAAVTTLWDQAISANLPTVAAPFVGFRSGTGNVIRVNTGGAPWAMPPVIGGAF